MRIKYIAGFLLLLLLAFQPVYPKDLKLPKTEIMGKEFYYYDVKKGESIYGIAKRFGWNLDTLAQLNSNLVSGLHKGDRLYYPVNMSDLETVEKNITVSDPIEYEPINHKVKKGETIYGISKQYNIPIEKIYSKYPSTKHGVKVGEVLVFEQTPETVAASYYYHNVKPDETLSSLARDYNTTIEDILKVNPGVTDRNFKAGQLVRLDINSNAKKIQKEYVSEDKIKGIDSYKVGKNETWSSIANSTGVDEDLLKEVNKGMSEPVQNETVTVPIIETEEVEREFIPVDSRELTDEGIKNIYDSVHGVTDEVVMLSQVNVALLLDDPSSNKDVDFTRGMLVALKELGNRDFKINLKVFDGRSAPGQVELELEDFSPHIVFATADKAFPAFLADYGNTNEVEIVNVFDVRNDLYEDNPSMVQLLPSSGLFNENVAEYILNNFRSDKIIFLGERDENDGLADLLLSGFPAENIIEISLSDFSEFTPESGYDYLVYSYGGKKEEIADILQTLDNIRESAPELETSLMGRQNWVLFIDDFSDKFSRNNVIIPTRIWLDTDKNEWNDFVHSYEELFGGEPIKSIPNFAANGYDAANYFIEGIVENGGDFNRGFKKMQNKSLQSQYDLRRINNWGGFMNNVGYLLQFNPWGDVKKIVVK